MSSLLNPARAALLLVALAALVAKPGLASEQAPEPEPEPEPAASKHRLEWNYPRFRYWEWGIALVGTGYFTSSVLQDPRRVDMGWHEPLPGDDPARNLFVAEGHAGRRKANNASNALWHVTEFFPFADSIIVPL